MAANPTDLGERLTRLARETGADVYGTNSGWVEDGVSFGSHWVVQVKKPAIAMAWDTPSQTASAGPTRFVLERQYGYPVTPIRTSQLAGTDLSKFQVLILPSGGNYASALGEAGIERVKNWVDAGGTIVAVGDAVNFLGNSKVDLLELVQENALREDEKKAAEKPEKGSTRVPGSAIASQADFDKVTRANTELPDSVPGAIARVRVRQDYWLTAGMGETVYTMVEGRAIYAPVKADKGINAAYYDAADKLVVSGYLWAENKKQMAFKPLVVSGTSGRGIVVGFTQDPNFRAIGDGLNILFLNAVFRGPAPLAGRGGGGSMGQSIFPKTRRGAEKTRKTEKASLLGKCGINEIFVFNAEALRRRDERRENWRTLRRQGFGLAAQAGYSCEQGGAFFDLEEVGCGEIE